MHAYAGFAIVHFSTASGACRFIGNGQSGSVCTFDISHLQVLHAWQSLSFAMGLGCSIPEACVIRLWYKPCILRPDRYTTRKSSSESTVWKCDTFTAVRWTATLHQLNLWRLAGGPHTGCIRVPDLVCCKQDTTTAVTCNNYISSSP